MVVDTIPMFVVEMAEIGRTRSEFSRLGPAFVEDSVPMLVENTPACLQLFELMPYLVEDAPNLLEPARIWSTPRKVWYEPARRRSNKFTEKVYRNDDDIGTPSKICMVTPEQFWCNLGASVLRPLRLLVMLENCPSTPSPPPPPSSWSKVV